MIIQIIVSLIIIYILYRVFIKPRWKKYAVTKDYLIHQYGKKMGLNIFKKAVEYSKRK